MIAGFYLPAKGSDDSWLTLTPEQISAALNWQSTPEVNTVCEGYYKDIPIITPANMTDKQTHIHSKNALLRKNKPSELVGDVKVTQIGKMVTGDKAISYTNSKTNKIEKLDVLGNVHLREPGFLAVGNEAHVNLADKSGSLQNATFRYQIPEQPRELVYNDQHRLTYIEVQGSNYRGDARKIEQTTPKHVVFHHVAFTTCNPYSDAWKIKTTTLAFNQETGMGTAYNAFLYLHGVPVLYTPWIRFPIDNKRKSGFLMPNYQYSQNSGSTISTPYYWSMAPNYDMTITPNVITKRGTKVDDLFRYLDNLGSGEIYFSALPNDRAFAQLKNAVLNNNQYPDASTAQKNDLANSSTNRYEFAWQDQSQFSPNWQSLVNIDYVNDDYYLQDFPTSPLRSTTEFSDILPTTQLTQSMSLNYTSLHWSVDTELENFQTLHPANITDNAQDQYARLPDISISGLYPDIFHHVNLNLNSEMTYFAHPLFENNYPTNLASVTGFRYNFYPSTNIYLAKPWGYVEPQITLTKTFYQLNDPVINTANPALSQQRAMQRFVPIFDLDTGLYFDRDFKWGQSDFTQTLEPRLFYLYAPYVDQANFPNFDSSLNPALTFDQMFSINRFQGSDRYGDANQLTVGMTSRFLRDSNGDDVLDMSLGQIVYFENRRVHSPDESAVELKNDTNNLSPLVGQLAWQFLHAWNLTGNIAYNTQTDRIQNSSMSLNYAPDAQHYLTAGTTYIQDQDETSSNSNFQQANLGFVWPLTVHWHTIGGIVYNISQSFTQTYLYGLQYNSCCWAIRVVDAKRYIGLAPNSNQPQYDPTIYLQFVLTGLTAGTLGSGSSPTSLMQYTIPGFNDTFGQNPLLKSRVGG
jgi:LPS-assembly protein